jgi:regulator of nucleoside diphosphate kinase
MGEIMISHEDFNRIELVIAEGRTSRSDRDRQNLDRLDRELRRARRVAVAERPADVVALEAEVTVRDLDDQTEATYQLVLPAKADVARNRLSVLAPIGAALLGYRRGDQIDWPVPGGRRRLRIERVAGPVRTERIEGA